jgi:hypothetical protein
MGRWLGLVVLLAGGEEPAFLDATKESGIAFRHRHGGSGDKHMVETMAGGGGFWDYDADGDLDVYLLNGAPLPGYEGPRPLTNALYRNEGGRFVDVTVEAGLPEPSYSMGSLAADYDDDGDLDLYVTSFGPNHLYRNEGDGTFTEVTETAGVGETGLSTSAAFGDVDGDGDLDLYVANYIEYSLEGAVYCGDRTLGIRTYCHPDNYVGAPDVLYRNEGDGRFSDVSVEAGVSLKEGKGLGVIFTDFDEDGDPDIYVANDSTMNYLFLNLGGGRFEETALALGVGFDEDGRAEGSMGVDAGDYDGDVKLDLWVTNFESEGNTLYRNLGDGTYADATYAAGLALPSLPWVGFGTGFFDFDNDADVDIFVANGHIMDHPSFLSDATRYAQPKGLYRNEGGRFDDVSRSAGEPFGREAVGRGTAFGDWDDDGDPDLLVMNNNDVPNLLRNETENGNHWTLLRLVGRRSNRDAIGAVVRIEAGGKRQIDELRCGYSYLSMNDPRLHFGLGTAGRIDHLEIRWPSGLNQVFSGLPADRLILLLEGSEPEGFALYRLP